MKNFNFQDCRKAVNQASFRPTAERKAAAVKLLTEALDFINNLEEVATKPSKKAGKKRRRKTTKRATSQQRVADRQERQFHGKADGVVTPSKKAKTASVEEARKSAQAVSEATGAAQRAAKKAEVKAKALKEEAKTQPKVDKSEERLASLEAKIEALTECLAVAMESMTPPAQEFLGFDDVPFTL